ncbi:MAG: glycosyltransferase family 2 protein [Deferribacteraceae bacterium]|nr:glycosyltransferase family 2 protein [Deferribacteraceae bacterium]
MFNPCVVIPVYRHANVLDKFISGITDLPVIIVNDGNNITENNILKEITQRTGACLVSLNKNKGKGEAVLAGFEEAERMGYTHALQIDADAQHDPSAVNRFIIKSDQNPDALINSYPVYDNSAVSARRWGRKITNFWVVLETLSFDIKDAMCGFRLYPLAQVKGIMKTIFSKRMGFDIEIVVKIHRAGIKIINLPVNVIYPEGGYSNYRMLTDNIKISLLHSYLLLTMPVALMRKNYEN